MITVKFSGDIDEQQREAFKTWLVDYSDEQIEELVQYVSKLRNCQGMTQNIAERLVLRRLKDKIGAGYDPSLYEDIPQEFRGIS